MKAKTLAEGAERTFAVIFERGDEAKAGLEAFAREQSLTAARLSGVGAFERVTLGYFDWARKTYDEIGVDEQVEVVSFLGDVALKDGAPEVHAHVAVARRDGTMLGGHLLNAVVRPTLEVMVVESPAHLRKEVDPESGLALIVAD